MSNRRIPNWLLLILVSIGLPVVAIPVLWVFVSVTATPLHPNPENIPAVMLSAPSPKWAGIAGQGRKIVRESVAGQNLPGLSVAVGIDGEIVWAEGFGLADLKHSVPVTPNHRFRFGTASTALTSAVPGEDFPLVNMIRELIYDPEATRASTPVSTKKPNQDRVTFYFPRFASDPKYGMHLMRPMDYSCCEGSTVFQSTPSELVRFAMSFDHGNLLQPGKETRNGLVWYVKTVPLGGKQTRVIGHDGDILGGMVASLMTIPEYKIVVAVMSNISYADTFSIAREIVEAFVKPYLQR